MRTKTFPSIFHNGSYFSHALLSQNPFGALRLSDWELKKKLSIQWAQNTSQYNHTVYNYIHCSISVKTAVKQLSPSWLYKVKHYMIHVLSETKRWLQSNIYSLFCASESGLQAWLSLSRTYSLLNSRGISTFAPSPLQHNYPAATQPKAASTIVTRTELKQQLSDTLPTDGTLVSSVVLQRHCDVQYKNRKWRKCIFYKGSLIL